MAPQLDKRALYEELGRQLGVTAEAELAEAERKEARGVLLAAIAAASGMVAAVSGMNTLKGLEAVGLALVQEGERLREVAAKFVEAGLLAEATEADRQYIRSAGFEPCALCGAIGEHICRAAAGLPPVEEVTAISGALLDPTAWR